MLLALLQRTKVTTDTNDWTGSSAAKIAKLNYYSALDYTRPQRKVNCPKAKVLFMIIFEKTKWVRRWQARILATMIITTIILAKSW